MWPFTRRAPRIDEELCFHRDRLIEDFVARGLTPVEARRQAFLELGNITAIEEDVRDARGGRWAEDVLRDVRYAIRVLRRSPSFTAVAIFSLALGIGANTAIFGLIDRVQLQSLPVRNPEQLVQLTRVRPPYGPISISYPLFQTLQANLSSVEGLLAQHALGPLDIRVDGELESADIDLVSGSYYKLLGINAVIGRTFDEDVDAGPGSHPVAVLSHRYWQRRFGSSPAAIGSTFRRLDTVFTIVGVTPPTFFGTSVGREPDIVIPLSMDAQTRGGESWLPYPNRSWLTLMGRRRPETGVVQVQREVSTVFAAVVADDVRGAMSDIERRGRLGEYVEVQPAANGFDDLRRRFSEPLYILMATVALLLLLACANLTNLLLARAAARQREIALRLALGAGRGRVIHQLLIEGAVLALMAGTLGVAIAYGFAQWLLTTMSNGDARIALDLTPEPRMLLFATALSLLASLAFSLMPALRATQRRVQDGLAGMVKADWRRTGNTLVVVQTSLSVLLVIVAGLFGRTLVNIYGVDAGFERDGVMLFSTNARRLGLDRVRMQELQMRLPDALAELPRVKAATVSMFLPLRGGWDASFVVEGVPESASEDHLAYVNSVGPGFFDTFRTPLVLGRSFTTRDADRAPRVAIVNQAFVRHYFPDRNPLGRWVAFRGPEQGTRYGIVGVAKDVPYRGLRSEAPRMVYMAAAQVPPGPDSYTFALRTDAPSGDIVSGIQEALSTIDAGLRPANVMTLNDHVARTLLRERILAVLAGCFGLLALLLSGIGVYGVMAYQVTRRRREIGVRMALGATVQGVLGMLLGETAKLTLLGCVIGAMVGLVATRSAAAILYGITPRDPITFAGAVACLVGVALVAAGLPSYRAARVNAMEALRTE